MYMYMYIMCCMYVHLLCARVCAYNLIIAAATTLNVRCR